MTYYRIGYAAALGGRVHREAKGVRAQGGGRGGGGDSSCAHACRPHTRRDQRHARTSPLSAHILHTHTPPAFPPTSIRRRPVQLIRNTLRPSRCAVGTDDTEGVERSPTHRARPSATPRTSPVSARILHTHTHLLPSHKTNSNGQRPFPYILHTHNSCPPTYEYPLSPLSMSNSFGKHAS